MLAMAARPAIAENTLRHSPVAALEGALEELASVVAGLSPEAYRARVLPNPVADGGRLRRRRGRRLAGRGQRVRLVPAELGLWALAAAGARAERSMCLLYWHPWRVLGAGPERSMSLYYI